MAARDRTTADILRSVEDTLATAEHGLKEFATGPAETKLAGFRNVVVFGRAVTNVLQNLRSNEPGLDEWYATYREQMKSDPLMRYFYELRSAILKEGTLPGLSTRIHIRRLRVPEDLGRLGLPPPNARGFFVGDSLGGSGWEVELPDGSVEKYYVELPFDIGTVSLHLPEAPRSHLGQEIGDSSLETLSRLYVNYLRRMVESAEERFKPRQEPERPPVWPVEGSATITAICPETPEDYAAIGEVNLLAFGREVEARLVENLRRSPDFIPGLSLVAVQDGEVVGHILFSPLAIETESATTRALALAVLSVRPELQKQGIGSDLVRDGLERCRSLGHRIVVVVGHAEYYPRFGFSSARAKGLETPFPVPDEAFMVLGLVPGALDGVSGLVKYPSAFAEP